MRTVLSVAAFILVLVYPGIVYYALTELGARELSWLLLPVLAVAVLSRLPRERNARIWDALKVPAAMALLIALTAVFDDHRFLLVTPVLVNAILLAGFAGSLRTRTPLVERFARMQVADLSGEEVEYCRQVTLMWSAFFVLNGSTAALLALWAPLSWWALYTGLLAYLLVGMIGASEYVVRKYRFGRYGTTPLDRGLRVLLQRRPVRG
jgi:uncharacterized membrane protein